MANTYTLISSNVLGSSAASVTFSSIPATYTDLVLRISDRLDNAGTSTNSNVQFNGDTATNYSRIVLAGSGSAASSSLNATQAFSRYLSNGGGTTASTFDSTEIYIPSYQVSQNKPLSIFTVTETNATAVDMQITASLWRNTAAITSITLTPSSGNYVSGSSFYLYGIKNS
jgi:hypothetical protein